MSKTVNPFPGLRPFRENEAPLFFGRKRHVNEIYSKLIKNRFVSVVGNSGSGKSSLVRAGLIPLLNQESWHVCRFRPGNDPVHSLQMAFQQIWPEANHASELDAMLRKGPLGIVQAVRTFNNSQKPVLILVDQFEELFRDNHTEKKRFAENESFIQLLLQASLQSDLPIYILLTMRSDFLGECEYYHGLPEAINESQFLVPRMQRDDLQDCLTGPVEYVGEYISPRLVQQLLDEIDENQDQLPVLQHVMMRTWEIWVEAEKESVPIDLEHYKKTGGIQLALNNHAEEAYSELNTEQQRICEVLFRSLCAGIIGGRGIRKSADIQTIAQIAQCSEQAIIPVAEIFRRHDRGFLLPDSSKKLLSDTKLDISHESLMRIWHRLSNWVKEEVEAAALYVRIAESALLFNEGKAGLWRDPDLQVALEWREKQNPTETWAKPFNPHFHQAMKFIQASEKEKWYAEKDSRRRRFFANVVITLVLLVLSVLSIWAYSERNNAEKSAQDALLKKAEADTMRNKAEEQTQLALDNFKEARQQEQLALKQKEATEVERQRAIELAEKARVSKIRAENESKRAIESSILANQQRQSALYQKQVSDSLRIIAEQEEKKATKLRILSLAQNLAIRSKLADTTNFDKQVKALLTLQAYRFQIAQGGNPFDPVIMNALLSATRTYQKSSEYLSYRHNDAVLSLQACPNQDMIVSSGNDGKLLFSTSQLKPAKESDKSMPMILDNLSYNASGERLAVSCDNRSIMVYSDQDPSKAQFTIIGKHDDEITAVVWNGSQIISASLDQHIRVFDSKTGEQLKSIELTSKPLALAVNPDKELVYAGCKDGKIIEINLKDGTNKVYYEVYNDRITSLVTSNDHSVLVFGTGNGKCKGIGLNQQSELFELNGHRAGIENMRFHPSQKLLATACFDGKVRLYDLENWQSSPPVEYDEHNDWVMDVAFTSDGLTLFSASKDKTLRSYPVFASQMADYLTKKIGRNFTSKEWNLYIGEDIPYQKTIPNLP
ncbi:MAG: hypothetical protein GC180_03710 [Bacteroidetes bacterium]|nr:hypothetical protein [Bacteroidota bacterium]